MIFFFLILYYLTPVFYPTYLLVLCFERKSCFSDVLKMYCVDLAAFRKNLNCLHTWSQDYRVADHNGGEYILNENSYVFSKYNLIPFATYTISKKDELSKKKHFSLLLKIWFGVYLFQLANDLLGDQFVQPGNRWTQKLVWDTKLR